jgi:formylglycine-generating enzyme required for sulfatase activity
VPVHELGVDADGRLFFTMRLIEGHTFADAIRWVRRGERGFTLVRALEVLGRAFEAVAHAHRRGVIHRDLKPSNVMVGNFGETYVVDWGLARVTSSPAADAAPASAPVRIAGTGAPSSDLRTLHGAVLGTPHYMAPEQAEGRLDDVGPAADVYSGGAMLYHLLAGHAPYDDVAIDADASDAVIDAVRAGPPTPIGRRAADAAPELVSICEKAMRRAARDRYADMGELAADLRAFLEVRVVRAHRTGALAELRKWIARNRLATAAALVALAVVLGGFGSVAGFTIKKNHQLADANAEAQARYDDVARLEALKRARDLAREADRIWPATEAQVPAMERWLAQAHDVAGGRPRHVATLASLSAGAALDPAFTAWWRESLEELLHRIDALQADEPARVGTIAEMESRRQRAQSLSRRSLEDHEEEWRDAIAAVADEPCYAGLALAPQLGLAPLGPDPDSGLLECWQVDSGDAPARDAATRHLLLTDTSALVFVLLPGGTFSYGAAPRDARPGEAAVAVELAPFFLSKFEMTQAQWLRVTASNPSHHGPDAGDCRLHHTRRHPVENVSWRDASAALARLGLVLPTAAQWEYAERAGTTTRFPTGDLPATLRGSGNLGDRSLLSLQAIDRREILEWEDGFPCTAPVGSFAPNAFGLFDLVGNVSEFGRERRIGRHADAEFAAGDGEQRPRPGTTASDERVSRGSNFEFGSLASAPSAYETSVPEDAHDERHGVRPARPLER